MGKALTDFALQTGQSALGQAMGLVVGGIQNKRQLKQQGKLQAQEIKGQKEMVDYNMARQMQMWKDTNYMPQMQMWKDTNYMPQMEELKKAGLNPGLIYGMSGGGGTTTGQPTGNVTGGHAQGSTGTEAITMGATMAQMGLLRAQKENIEADTANKKADIPVKDATVPNIQADTENKILNAIILKYTGKEIKDTYEQVKSPARGVEAKTHQDEMEARQGIAGTIYEMWTEGKLKDKAIGEITQILLQNAKTSQETEQIKESMKLLEENIKGAKLDNIIKDLESRLQTETGIDKSSSGILKILGRLFLKLTGK